MYMEDLVRPEILSELQRRLDCFEIDGILDGGSLEQLLEKKWYSPFPQFQSTQRPDKAASALLEGRVVVLADNSPEVLMLPAVAGCFYQASDDYYDRSAIASFTRFFAVRGFSAGFFTAGTLYCHRCFSPGSFPYKSGPVFCGLPSGGSLSSGGGSSYYGTCL